MAKQLLGQQGGLCQGFFKHCKQTEETLSLNSPSGRLRLSQESCAKLLPHTLYPDDRHSPRQRGPSEESKWTSVANPRGRTASRGEPRACSPRPAPSRDRPSSEADWDSQL